MGRLATPVVVVLFAALTICGYALGALGITRSPTRETTPTVTLSGDDQTRSWNETVTITGGTATGWNVTAWAALPTASGNTLPALSVETQPGASCTGPGCVVASPSGITWPVTLGTTSGSASKVMNAKAGTGTGTETLTVPVTLSVPGSALPGTYTTTITLTVATGP